MWYQYLSVAFYGWSREKESVEVDIELDKSLKPNLGSPHRLTAHCHHCHKLGRGVECPDQPVPWTAWSMQWTRRETDGNSDLLNFPEQMWVQVQLVSYKVSCCPKLLPSYETMGKELLTDFGPSVLQLAHQGKSLTNIKAMTAARFSTIRQVRKRCDIL